MDTTQGEYTTRGNCFEFFPRQTSEQRGKSLCSTSVQQSDLPGSKYNLRVQAVGREFQHNKQINSHLNITLRQQDRLCVSCLSRFGFALPMNPDFHNRLRCSLPELKLLANLQQGAISLFPLFIDVSKQTYVLVEDSQGGCKDDGGRDSRTCPSPPSCHPPCRPCSPLMSASPTPGLLTGSLHLLCSITSNI